MLGRVALRLCGSVGIAAVLAAPLPASAQCRLCSGETQIASAAEKASPPVVQIDTNLQFGGLLLSGNVEGAATLHPDGSSSVTGGIAGLSGSRMVGTVRVQGEPGRMVRINLPQRVELYSVQGEVVVIEQLLTDLPRVPRLDAAGRLTFRFGGKLKVGGDADGEYRGDLPLTVDYL